MKLWRSQRRRRCREDRNEGETREKKSHLQNVHLESSSSRKVWQATKYKIVVTDCHHPLSIFLFTVSFSVHRVTKLQFTVEPYGYPRAAIKKMNTKWVS